MELAATIESLHDAYAKPHSLQAPLNIPLREALRRFAASQSFQFSEDNAGNNYITRRGSDSGLAPIAIAFPLDGTLSETSFKSALRVFMLHSKVDLPCDLVLVGWTSMGSRLIGREIWEASATASGLGDTPPGLERFKGMENPQSASVSAIFEIREQIGTLRIDGSPVLIDQLRKLVTVQADFHQSLEMGSRAPWISIAGSGAESVACSAIKDYSAYIVALFDNFD
ncbi:hypothetical protein GGS26DRAFT_589730 [Hypomontagnella submonticulosa]|nr:hypothetical protein GGS26DRAFT_589730 [Hypomontagnella submonticulosa]